MVAAQDIEGASLRAIAKAAGVTTGAIYGYFLDKKALFDAPVSQPAQKMLDQFISMQEELAALPPERQASEMVQTSNEDISKGQIFDWMADRPAMVANVPTAWALSLHSPKCQTGGIK